MAKGRKPTAPATKEGPDFVVNTPAAIADAEARTTQIAAAYSDERDLVNQVLGQAQAFSAAAQLLQTFGVSKLAFVKENKLYRALQGKTTPNGLELQGTWEEFCGLLGMSDEKANQDIANLRAFGEEALESMSRMGIGYREMRQFRRLPDDERLALIETAKTGDKDALLDIAETLIAKHQREREEKDKKIAEMAAEAEATGRILEDKNKKLDDLAKKGKKRVAADPWPEEVAGLNEEVASIGTVADEVLSKHLTFIDAAETLIDNSEEDSDKFRAAKSAIHHIGAAVERLCHLAASLREHYDTRIGGYIADDKTHVLDAGN